MTDARELTGMSYKAVELKHRVGRSVPNVLRDLATWMETNGQTVGVIVDITTQCSMDDDDVFLTTFVWAEA